MPALMDLREYRLLCDLAELVERGEPEPVPCEATLDNTTVEDSEEAVRCLGEGVTVGVSNLPPLADDRVTLNLRLPQAVTAAHPFNEVSVQLTVEHSRRLRQLLEERERELVGRELIDKVLREPMDGLPA